MGEVLAFRREDPATIDDARQKLIRDLKGSVEINDHMTEALRRVIRIQDLGGTKMALQFLMDTLAALKPQCGND